MKTKDDNNIEMPDEYVFDYSKAKPNKFAEHFYHSTIKVYDNNKLVKELKPVILDKELVDYFDSTEKINEALRELIESKR